MDADKIMQILDDAMAKVRTLLSEQIVLDMSEDELDETIAILRSRGDWTAKNDATLKSLCVGGTRTRMQAFCVLTHDPTVREILQSVRQKHAKHTAERSYGQDRVADKPPGQPKK